MGLSRPPADAATPRPQTPLAFQSDAERVCHDWAQLSALVEALISLLSLCGIRCAVVDVAPQSGGSPLECWDVDGRWIAVCLV